MIALVLYRIAALDLISQTPFSVFPYGIAVGAYSVRRSLIECPEMVAEMHFLEQVCIMLLDGFPTVNRTFIRHLNRVLRVERGKSGGIVVIPCNVKFLNERKKLL